MGGSIRRSTSCGDGPLRRPSSWTFEKPGDGCERGIELASAVHHRGGGYLSQRSDEMGRGCCSGAEGAMHTDRQTCPFSPRAPRRTDRGGRAASLRLTPRADCRPAAGIQPSPLKALIRVRSAAAPACASSGPVNHRGSASSPDALLGQRRQALVRSRLGALLGLLSLRLRSRGRPRAGADCPSGQRRVDDAGDEFVTGGK